MSGPCVNGSARTVYGSLGGSLKDVTARELAETAALAALDSGPVGAADLEQVICAIGLPTEGADLGLAAAVAEAVGASAACPTRTLIGVDAAGAALLLGHRSASAGRRVLLVGADSASRAAYWIGGVRLGASEDASFATDPLGPALDPLGERGSPPHLLEEEAGRRDLGRAELDRYATRSHSRAAAAASAVPVAGLQRDELVLADPDAAGERIAASPSLHTRGGDLTVANCAAPIDGAAAVVLTSDGGGPALSSPVETAVEAGKGSAAAAAARAAGEEGDWSYAALGLGECSAAQALIAIAELGADADSVNPAGGGIATGRPTSGEAIALLAGAAGLPGDGPIVVADESPTGSGLALLLSP